VNTKMLPGLGIVLIIETGLTHLFSAPHEFEHAAYLGYLFMLNFLAALLAGYGIYRRQVWGWALGFALAAASIAGYVLSRTFGLPGMEVEEWLSPIGLLSLAVEGLFVLLFVLRPWRLNTLDEGRPISPVQPVKPSMLSHSLPALVMFLMVAVIGAANQLESSSLHTEGDHLTSLAEITSLAPHSVPEFEQQHGVRVVQVTISGQDSLVEVRLEVVDPEKANALLEEHIGLFVDGDALIPAPGVYVHGDFKPGYLYVMSFPNQDKVVRAGSQVSLVFNHERVEPIIAR